MSKFGSKVDIIKNSKKCAHLMKMKPLGRYYLNVKFKKSLTPKKETAFKKKSCNFT